MERLRFNPPKKEKVALLVDKIYYLVEDKWRDFTRYHALGKTIDEVAKEINKGKEMK